MSQEIHFHRVTTPELRVPRGRFLWLLPRSRRLAVERRRVERWFKRLFQEAKDNQRRDQLREAYGMESVRLEAQEAKLLSEYWMRKARRLRLPTPMWGKVMVLQ